MADAIRRYRIPATSRVHNTVAYSFIVQTLRPEKLSTDQILKLLRVAKVLGPTQYEQLLQDVFFLRPLQLEVLPIEPIASDHDTDCVILLANLMLRGAACRAEIASTLLSSSRTDETLHLHERNDLATWILEGSPSLQEINARFESIRRAVDLQREQLLDVNAAIQEATADIGCYVRTTFVDDQEREEGRTEEVAGVDARQKIKRLEVRIADEGRMSRKSLDVCDLDLERVSSNGTEFEDIEAYSGPMGSMSDGCLDFTDDESVRSIKTV
ncbi:hypothetical protein G6011_09556 [Alternaria panax]|uniref:Uncharacterized protein n=1 Tax=Alternaria panax TaxID=48097 RepID=A0AAD4I5F8_9PLEO|nr:hypothetical protein G6011_09556 [Alternaria panax]